MKKMICAGLFTVLVMVACNKKAETSEAVKAGVEAAKLAVSGKQNDCVKEIITDRPVKVTGSDVVLPAKTRLCFSADNMEIRIELPAGYAFGAKEGSVMEKTLPIWATYACYCSSQGSACNVFYADGLGFGCLQSSCSGSCTGKFTYKGYSLDRVINLADKSSFFNSPDVQQQIRELTKDVSPLEAYGKFSVMGVSFYLVQDEKAFLQKATCDCEGTQACKLKTINLPLLKGETQGKKIYYCEGPCNGCELTV